MIKELAVIIIWVGVWNLIGTYIPSSDRAGNLMLVLFGSALYLSQTNTTRNRIVEKLVRQAARWSIASKQDSSPMVALLHANYGVGYLGALEDSASVTEIENVVGDFDGFKDKIISAQDVATKKVSNACRGFIGDSIDMDLAKLSGNY